MKRLALFLAVVVLAVLWMRTRISAWLITDPPASIGYLGGGNAKMYANNSWIDIEVDSTGNKYVTLNNNSHVVRKYDSSWNFIEEWGSQGSTDGKFTTPVGIAIDSAGNVYVVDSGNNRIQKFTADGVYITKWGTAGSGDGQFNSPFGIAVDGSDNIYVTDSSNARVQKFSNTGTFLSKFGSAGSGDGQFNTPRDITVDNAGNIWVADQLNSRIQKFDSTGAYLTKSGSLGSGDGQFVFITGIDVDNSDNLYVADGSGGPTTRVQKFDSSGAFVSKFGSYGTGDGQFTYPFGLTIDTAGTIYVADGQSFFGRSRIQQFNLSGVFQSKVGDAVTDNGQVYGPWGLALDSSENIYVADSNNNRIVKFNPDGTYNSKWGTLGAGDGQFDSPYGVDYQASTNRIYVADTYNNRIEVFDTSGNFIVAFGSGGAGNGQFCDPYGTAFDQSGNIYVVDACNNRIQKFDSMYNYVTSITGNGGAFNYPNDVLIDSADNIYVADSSNNRVQKFDSSLSFVTQWTGHGTAFNYNAGIAMDTSGNIFVSDYSNGRVQVFDSSGVFESEFGSNGTILGEFDGPAGIAVSSTGNVYVAEGLNERVQIFKFDRTVGSSIITSFPSDTTTDSTPTITGTATDTQTAVTAVEFVLSSDPGNWHPCTADDGLFDETTEAFTCQVTSTLSTGTETVSVRVTDSATNTNTTGNDTDYTFTVANPPAVSASPSSSSSPSSPAPTTAPAPGSAPLITGADVDTTLVTLHFTPGEDPLTHYSVVYGRTSAVNEYGANPVGDANSTSLTIDSLLPDTTYYFVLTPMNDGTPGPASSVFSAHTRPTETTVEETVVTIVDVQGPTQTEPDAYDIVIHLENLAGDPATNVRVVLTPVDGGSSIEGVTGADGSLDLALVAVGDYHVMLYPPTGGEVPESLSVNAGSDKIITFRLGDTAFNGGVGTTDSTNAGNGSGAGGAIVKKITDAISTYVTPENAVAFAKAETEVAVAGAGAVTVVSLASVTSFVSRALLSLYSSTARSLLNLPRDLASSLGKWFLTGLSPYLPFVAMARRRRRSPGIVFNAITNEPVTGAYVVFYSQSGNLKTDFTDKEGRYYVEPTPDEYAIRVHHSRFGFPSKLVTSTSSSLFQHIYQPGEKIAVSQDKQAIADIAIALDPQERNLGETVLLFLKMLVTTTANLIKLPLGVVMIFLTTVAVMSERSGFTLAAFVLVFVVWGTMTFGSFNTNKNESLS